MMSTEQVENGHQIRRRYNSFELVINPDTEVEELLDIEGIEVEGESTLTKYGF
jgi:hypothetical protein